MKGANDTPVMREYETRRQARLLRRRRDGIRRVAGMLLVAAAVAALVSLAAGERARVNGRTVWIGRRATVADCARKLRLRTDTGDLLDVEGMVLRRGGGARVRVWVNEAPAPLSAPVAAGDVVRIIPAHDVTEQIADQIQYLHSPCLAPDGTPVAGSETARFVQGIRRNRRGALSGKPVSEETMRAAAIVHPLDSPHRSPCVAFTFDDGPNTTWTPQVLETLEAHGARGTFFVLGQAVGPLSDVFRRILAGGHEVGTHSWRHDYFTKLSAAAARADLERCVEVMKREGAVAVRWFRPPGGFHSERVDAVAAELGLRIAMWDIDPFDWKRPGADVIVSRVMKDVRDCAVVLLHDGPREREQTIEALDRLLAQLRAHGYQFVTMSEAKGLVPVFTGEMVLQAGAVSRRLAPMPARTKLFVNCARVATALPPLRTDGDILVPAAAVLSALGHESDYDKGSETLMVRVDGKRVALPLNSLRGEADGEQVSLGAPVVLYAGGPFMPLSLLKSIIPVSCVLDEVRLVLTITSVEGAPFALAPASRR